jgi:HEAT repeat protein
MGPVLLPQTETMNFHRFIEYLKAAVRKKSIQRREDIECSLDKQVGHVTLVPAQDKEERQESQQLDETIFLVPAQMATIIQNEKENLFHPCDLNTLYEKYRSLNIGLRALAFRKEHATPNDALGVFALASLNRNGHVREKAVRELVAFRDGRAIPFLLYRMADWVPEVRDLARAGLACFMEPEFLPFFVSNLSIIEWLRAVGRVDLRPEHQRIMRFLLEENRDATLQSFRQMPDRVRFILARYLAIPEICQDALCLLRTDKLPLIRKLACRFLDQFTPDEIECLVRDRAASVRHQAFFWIVTSNTCHAASVALEMLSDNSAPIRALARQHMQANGMDFTAHYHALLAKERDVVGALLGLAEVDGRHAVETISRFLASPQGKVVRAAFRVLQSLDAAAAFRFAVEHLADARRGVRKVALNHVAGNPQPEALARARDIYREGTPELRRDMLELFIRIGRWHTLQDLILAHADEDAQIRGRAQDGIMLWRDRAARLYTTPDAAERAGIASARQCFPANEFSWLDFYLQ